MPSSHLLPRCTCSAKNAFNPRAALVAAFSRQSCDGFSSFSILNAPIVADPKQDQGEQPSEPAIEIRKIHKTNNPFIRKFVVQGEDNVPIPATKTSQEDMGLARKGHRRVSAPRMTEPSDYERRTRAMTRHQQAKDAADKHPDFARKLNVKNDNHQFEWIFRDKEDEGNATTPAQEQRWSWTLPVREDDVKHRGDNWKRAQHELGRRAQEISQKKISPQDTNIIKQRTAALDYEGTYIDPPRSPILAPLPVPWIHAYEDVRTSGVMDRLDKEIEGFAHWMGCTPMERAARAALIEELTSLVKRKAGSAVNVKTFGSEETGLATVLSDIDIRLSFHEGSSDPRKLMRRMKVLEHALSQHPDFILVLLRHAKYPIINAQHKHTGIDVQIVSAPDTDAQRDAMAHYLQTLPHLRPVYMVLKTALGIRGLVDVFNGGIGSYGLFMMLAAVLRRPTTNPPQTAAASLLHFLDFYSDLNTSVHGVSVHPPKLFKKHSVFTYPTQANIFAARKRGDEVRAAQYAIGQTRIYQPYLFCLQDPADPLNDLGRKSNAIKHLQVTVRVFRNTLKKYMRDCFPVVPKALPWRDGSMLLPLVGRCHEIYRDRRKRAEEAGRAAVERASATNLTAEAAVDVQGAETQQQQDVSAVGERQTATG